MYPQTSLFLYRFRFVFASILTLAFLLFISALVTAVGAHTILNTNTESAAVLDTAMSDSPNTITAGAIGLVNGVQQAGLSIGSGLYKGCRSVTNASAGSGKFIVHTSASILGGIWKTTAFLLSGIGSTIMYALRITGSCILFTVRMPGKFMHGLTATHTVNALIKPADTQSVPVIHDSSAAALARLSTAQQQQIAQWQAAQVTANRGLGGKLAQGDPAHGGYPVKWDATPKDSRIDSWGMYNRECVSYAAWKVYQTYGNMPYWGGVGNANEWLRNAKAAHIATSSTPRAHSVAISMRGYYGHAMWVEKVSGDMVYVSQYNYDLHGHYSEMWINSSYVTYIYFE